MTINDYNSRNNWFNGRVKRFVERTNPICTNTEFSKCATGVSVFKLKTGQRFGRDNEPPKAVGKSQI